QGRRKAGSHCWYEPERSGRGLEVTSLVATSRVPRHPRRGKRMDPVNRTGGPRDTTAERTLDRNRSSRMSTLPDVVAGRHVRTLRRHAQSRGSVPLEATRLLHAATALLAPLRPSRRRRRAGACPRTGLPPVLPAADHADLPHPALDLARVSNDHGLLTPCCGQG